MDDVFPEWAFGNVHCLAEVMFFEARSDGELGMEAVAKNVLTRHRIGYRGASSVCDVVRARHQYSYLWDDVPDVVVRSELPLYNKVLLFAMELYTLYSGGELPSDYLSVGTCPEGATHYHRWDVKPRWADRKAGSMIKTCGRIGSHIFYVGN